MVANDNDSPVKWTDELIPPQMSMAWPTGHDVGLGVGVRDVLGVGVRVGVDVSVDVVDGVGVAVDEGEGAVDDSVNATPDPTTEPSVVKRIV